MMTEAKTAEVAVMDAEAARRFLNERPAGSFTLLDVRQPWEYEERHLPGATLVPLGELPGRVQELDPAKPVLAYCAAGGRSRAAAQLLSSLGFREVYNLAGGIHAYDGRTATGPEGLHLELLRGDESPAEALTLAYGMERALQAFYEAVAQAAQDAELASFCRQMVQVEAAHQERLRRRYEELTPKADPASLATAGAEVMEGGFRLSDFLARNAPYLTTLAAALELALTVETQALDLYLRLAQKSQEEATRQVLYEIAEEEKAHLAALSRLWEQKRG